jgi:prepilin-type N-terminal cleavage/methylation domain-containing protein
MRSERGFTLPELLVVLLIIAILAAAGIATFVNQRSKAQDTEAKEAAALVATTLITYEHGADTFATADRNALIALEPAIAEARNLTLVTADDTFELSVDSASGASGGGPFRIEYAAGRTIRSCDRPGDGSCPDSGRW